MWNIQNGQDKLNIYIYVYIYILFKGANFLKTFKN